MPSSGLNSMYIISLNPYNMDIIVSILQAIEGPTDVKNHVTRMWQSQDSNLRELVSKANAELKGSFKASE